ncbi:MAG: YdeI/OmpD-associated family protein [Pseudomonadota bacterium]
MTDAPRITIRSRPELRAWLSENHGASGSVWCVTFKKHHPDYLEFGQVVEELMCWGWVDSSVRGVDSDSMMHLISPRKETSAWSAVNKDIVARMRASGEMTEAGEAKIAAAMANGMWTFLDDVERLERPEDLDAALGPETLAVWDAYPRSVKRGSLEWIKQAKTAPTRAKRIAEVLAACEEGRRPKPFAR